MMDTLIKKYQGNHIITMMTYSVLINSVYQLISSLQMSFKLSDYIFLFKGSYHQGIAPQVVSVLNFATFFSYVQREVSIKFSLYLLTRKVIQQHCSVDVVLSRGKTFMLLFISRMVQTN